MDTVSSTDRADLTDKAAEAARRGDIELLGQCFADGLRSNDTLQFAAEESGKPEVLQVLFDNGTDINAHIDYMGTPLSRCVTHRRKAMVRYLLDKGADPNIYLPGGGGLMPIALAVRMTKPDDTELLEMLLDAGASIPGTAALHMASLMGHLPKMRTLIVRGADINEVLTQRVRTHLNFFRFSTPLHWAIQGGHVDAVELLLAENPDLELKDEHGISVRDALKKMEIGSA